MTEKEKALRPEAVLFRKGWLMVLCIALSISALFFSLIVRSRLANDRSTDFCTDLNILNAAAQSNVIDQIPTRANLEKILYYRQHPGEIEARIQRDTARAIVELENLAQAGCGSPLPNPKLQALIRSTLR